MAWLLVALLMLIVPAARAAEPVDIALVLVSDVSRSIDDSEFALEKTGYAAAFTDPHVLAAIRGGAIGAIAVSYLEFAGADEVKAVVDWVLIRDDASGRAFAARLLAAPRSSHGRTAIGAGIARAAGMLAESGFEAQRRVIDVCGDGTNNSGPELVPARAAALAAGITVNGLAIINDHPVNYSFAHTQPPGGLAKYYRDNVAGGPGSFVLEIHDFHAFGTAMIRKLVEEIAAAGAPPARL